MTKLNALNFIKVTQLKQFINNEQKIAKDNSSLNETETIPRLQINQKAFSIIVEYLNKRIYDLIINIKISMPKIKHGQNKGNLINKIINPNSEIIQKIKRGDEIKRNNISEFKMEIMNLYNEKLS